MVSEAVLGRVWELFWEILVKMANKSAKMATKIAKLRPHRRICESPREFGGSRTGENPGAESLELLFAWGGGHAV